MLGAICTVCKKNKGKFRVENTGLEFVYSEKYNDEDGHDEASYLLCKYESSLYFALRQDRETPHGRGS